MTTNPLTKDQQKLVTDHMKIVYKFANEFANVGTATRDDLESAGMVKLCESASKYDASTGNAFSTFAYQPVRGAIADATRIAGSLGKGVFSSSEGDNGRKAFWEGKVSKSYQQGEVRLDALIGEDADSATVADTIGADSLDTSTVGGYSPDQIDALGAFGDTLGDSRDLLILDLYFLTDSPITLEKLGRIEGVSKQRMSQLANALRKRADSWLAKNA